MLNTKNIVNILIVDDDSSSVLAAKAALAGLYSVSVAYNGIDALGIAKSMSFDMILLDVIMPDLDGFEVCIRLKSLPSTRDIPIIFVSSYDRPEFQIRAFGMGAIDYIVKPFNREPFVSRVESHLNRIRQYHWNQRMLDSVGEGLYGLDLDGNVIFINSIASRMLGWTDDDLIGQSHRKFQHAQDEENYLCDVCPIHGAIFYGKFSTGVQSTFWCKDGTPLVVEYTVTPIFKHGEHLIGAVIVFRSIVDRLKMEEELRSVTENAESASRVKSEFIATMSHEIRTPLNAIIGLNDLALSGNISDKTRDYLTKIGSSSRLLLRIINDILDFSKIEAGKMVLEPAPFNLADLFDNIGNMFRELAVNKGLELNVFVADQIPLVIIGDETRLQQVLLNLISNAIKFTENGEIDVRAVLIDRTDSYLHLVFSVKDSGIGLDPEYLSCLFEPFTQADNSITRRFGGTGLGLHICKKLINMMGGTIDVESIQGSGSLFYFSAMFSYQPQEETTRTVLPDKIKSLRCLVVDDNETARHLTHTMLTDFGLVSTCVESGSRAISAVQSAIQNGTPYNLVFMDQRMPFMSGIETIEKLRKWYNPDLRIIMLTACSEQEIAELAHSVGVNQVLQKPVGRKALHNVIFDAFDLKDAKISVLTESLHQSRSEIRKRISGARVLLAEDNKINQQVAQEIMESVGLVVHVVNNGFEAVQCVMEMMFDLVLMDIQMPVLDGIEATCQIRTHPEFTNLPIVAMTAYAMPGDREKYLNAGMVDHVTKPIDKTILYSTLIKWIPPRPVQEVEELVLTEEEIRLESLAPSWVADLSGIVVADVMDRLDNKYDVFYFLLVDFYRHFSNSAETLKKLLFSGQSEQVIEAQNMVHTIRGMAGNLSAMQLFAIASRFENAIHNNEIELWPDLLADFDKEIKNILISISNICKDMNEPSTSPTNDDKVHLRLQITNLLNLLNGCDISVLVYFDSIIGILYDNFSVEGINCLRDMIKNLEFKEARNATNELLISISNPCKDIEEPSACRTNEKVRPQLQITKLLKLVEACDLSALDVFDGIKHLLYNHFPKEEIDCLRDMINALEFKEARIAINELLESSG